MWRKMRLQRFYALASMSDTFGSYAGSLQSNSPPRLSRYTSTYLKDFV